jgi:membrane-associated phospholipid phosphatase
VRGEIIPIWLATILASAIPIAIILVAQLRIKSFWDANNAVIGLLYSLVTAAAFQALLKWLVGGLRPHFLAVCQPDIRLAQGAQPDSLHDLGNESTGSGYGQLYYTSEICTGDRTEVNDSLESFPSGHATAAFAGFVYLSIYLNARLKVFSDHVSTFQNLSCMPLQ